MLERDADADTALGERLPAPFPRESDTDTDLQQWLAELQADADELDAAVDDVLDSLQVGAASDGALDELGKDLGRLGRRRGRPDDQYRAVLRGLVGAFDGRGTVPGVRLAIAVGILADERDVSLIEDFQEQEYEVVLETEAWTAHRSGTVRELADLADPSVVQLREPVHNRLATAIVHYSVDATVVAQMTTSEPAHVGYSVGDTQATTVDSEGTFGTGRFDGEGSFS